MLAGAITHLKAAVNESDVGAGEVKTSLNLGDGALHVGSRQSLGKAGEGECHNKELQKTEGKKHLIQRLLLNLHKKHLTTSPFNCSTHFSRSGPLHLAV